MTRIRQIMPSLVISDVMMPKKDGYELTKEVREDPAIRHIPIILLTARVDIGMKIESDKALTYLKEVGCSVNESSYIVRFPRTVVQRYVDKMRADYANPERLPERMSPIGMLFSFMNLIRLFRGIRRNFEPGTRKPSTLPESKHRIIVC